jgi:hypothetical protein
MGYVYFHVILLSVGITVYFEFLLCSLFTVRNNVALLLAWEPKVYERNFEHFYVSS